MCWQDIQLGRSTRVSQKVTIVQGAMVEIAAYNPHRFAIVIGAPFQAEVAISINPQETPGFGAMVSPNTPPLSFNIKDHGDLARAAFYAQSESSQERICVWEVYLYIDDVKELSN